MFGFLALVSLIGVIVAISNIAAERKRNKEANEKWKQFQDENYKE